MQKPNDLLSTHTHSLPCLHPALPPPGQESAGQARLVVAVGKANGYHAADAKRLNSNASNSFSSLPSPGTATTPRTRRRWPGWWWRWTRPTATPLPRCAAATPTRRSCSTWRRTRGQTCGGACRCVGRVAGGTAGRRRGVGCAQGGRAWWGGEGGEGRGLAVRRRWGWHGGGREGGEVGGHAYGNGGRQPGSSRPKHGLLCRGCGGRGGGVSGLGVWTHWH